MATLATHLFRLPSALEAQRILTAAIGAQPDSEQAKARRNLCKSLDWAYKGLSALDRQQAVGQYAGNLVVDLLLALQKPASVPDGTVLAMLNALIAGKADLQHPGGARYRSMTTDENRALGAAMVDLETHIQQMNRGTHDAYIDEVFPKEAGDALWGVVGYSNAQIVKHTFGLALGAIKRLRGTGNLLTSNIKVDNYAAAIKAGGLTNPQGMKFPPDFFLQAKAEMEAALAHEGTHAIEDATGYRTNDEGGYIGSEKWRLAAFAERRKNAAHFEAVIRRINGETLPTAATGRIDDEGQAKEIVRRAWDEAQFLYGLLYDYQQNPLLLNDPGKLQAARDISQLFGLGTHRKLVGTAHVISEGDLAAAENRVGKLGVLLGVVGVAATWVKHNNAPVTVDKILTRLVEMEGPLRKSTDNSKTVALIKTLAELNPGSVAKFVRKDYT